MADATNTTSAPTPTTAPKPTTAPVTPPVANPVTPPVDTTTTIPDGTTDTNTSMNETLQLIVMLLLNKYRNGSVTFTTAQLNAMKTSQMNVRITDTNVICSFK